MHPRIQRVAIGGLAALFACLLATAGSADHDVGLAAAGATGHSFEHATTGIRSHVVTQEGLPHTLILVDGQTKRVGIYHVDPVSGQLTLKSVREVGPDLQMDKFNSAKPWPEEIREALKQR